MFEWLLVITLYATIGISAPLTITGVPYVTMSECKQEGERVENWLLQDFQIVTWRCVKVPRQS